MNDMEDPQLIMALDDCLQALAGGELDIAGCLARYPEQAAALRPLLAAAQPMQLAPALMAPAIHPHASFRRQATKRLLSQLPPAAPRPGWQSWLQRRPSMFRVAFALVSILLAALVTGGGVVYAADSAVPGDALYGLDRALEQNQLNRTTSTKDAVTLRLSLAGERLAEAEVLTGRSNSAAAIQQTLADYGADLRAIAQLVDAAAPALRAELGEQVQAALQNQERIMARLRRGPAGEGGTGNADGTSNADIRCDDADLPDHPVGLSLAAEFGVPYDELYAWFCAGYGWGEIAMAYSVSAETGIPVADLLAQLTDTVGWGEILRDLDLLPGRGLGRPDEVGPPADPGPPDHAGPPDEVGPPDGAGPPDNAGPDDHSGAPDGVGPPDHANAPDHAGPNGNSEPPADAGPDDTMGPPDHAGTPGGGGQNGNGQNGGGGS